MRFLFFSKGDKSEASSRYRAYYLAEALQELGHEASVALTTKRGIGATIHYLRALLSTRSEDIVVLQRTVYNKYFLVATLIAYVFGKRFIFDIDDAVYEHSPMKSTVLAHLARAVTCGSEHVLQWAQKHNHNTHLLLNGLPLSIYTMRESEPIEHIIGWIGNGPAHYENLEFFVPILASLIECGVAFRFKLVGALGDKRIYELFKKYPTIPVTIVDSLNWSDPRQVVAEIHTFTVGVMPLTKTNWNQAKYFKALEYMACGIPVVASNTDTLKRIFSEGRRGTLACTHEEWLAALKKLIDNPILCAEEGVRARLYIEKKFSSNIMAKNIISIV